VRAPYRWRSPGDYSSVAEFAGASDRAYAEQFDLWRLICRLHRLLIRQRGTQVLLVVVAEDRHYHRVATFPFFLLCHSNVALLLWAVVAEVRYNVSSNYFVQRGQVAT